jgi:hypothetical protein
MANKMAKLCWALPEWVHVLMWFFTRYVPAEKVFFGHVVGYQWAYFDHLHKNL